MSDDKLTLWHTIDWYAASIGTKHERRERKALDQAIDVALADSGANQRVETKPQDELDRAAITASADAYRSGSTADVPTEVVPQGGCNDCRRPYGDEHGFPDLILPEVIWDAISPSGNSRGLLCPSCICKRLIDHKYKKVPVSFESGPCYIGEMSEIAPPIADDTPLEPTGELVEASVELGLWGRWHFDEACRLKRLSRQGPRTRNAIAYYQRRAEAIGLAADKMRAALAAHTKQEG